MANDAPVFFGLIHPLSFNVTFSLISFFLDYISQRTPQYVSELSVERTESEGALLHCSGFVNSLERPGSPVTM